MLGDKPMGFRCLRRKWMFPIKSVGRSIRASTKSRKPYRPWPWRTANAMFESHRERDVRVAPQTQCSSRSIRNWGGVVETLRSMQELQAWARQLLSGEVSKDSDSNPQHSDRKRPKAKDWNRNVYNQTCIWIFQIPSTHGLLSKVMNGCDIQIRTLRLSASRDSWARFWKVLVQLCYQSLASGRREHGRKPVDYFILGKCLLIYWLTSPQAKVLFYLSGRDRKLAVRSHCKLCFKFSCDFKKSKSVKDALQLPITESYEPCLP